MGLPFFFPIFIPGNTIHFYSVDPILEASIKLMLKNLNSQLSTSLITQIPAGGLKVDSEGKSYSHYVDTEGVRISHSKLGEDLHLYQDIDLLYFGAQYSFNDHLKRIDWWDNLLQLLGLNWPGNRTLK
jgi:hypothetical protein